MFFVIFVIFEFKDIDFVTYFQLTFVNFVNMNKNEVFCIGLMSGTSLDGIDLVYVKFYKNEYQNFKIIYTKTLSYTNKWKTTLQKAIHFSEDKLKDLDTKYGVFLGEKINIGFIFLLYKSCLSIFCTNSINIYAGINGLEVGQSIFISFGFLTAICLRLLNIDNSSNEFQTLMFCVIVLSLFISSSFALLKFNKYPSKVFVVSRSARYSGRCCLYGLV